eukprot:TRINITY_DN26066_c0_g1_i1.p1 TRINITY_DN26066_c0_g1~~TRINITY_DN26066_c0_g1_i1.p1  ORF type:complete len:177 (+),score=38.62 TRINITY_DN26066_c0_g1_i1:46-576(+)
MSSGEKREIDGGEGEEAKRRKEASEKVDISELDELEGFPKVVGGDCGKVGEVVKEYFKTMEESGESITQQLRGRRDFSNPDMLPNILKKYGINQYGTMLPTSVWAMPGPENPNGIGREDYFDEIIKAQSSKRDLQQQQSQPAPTTTVTRRSGIAGRPVPAPPKINPVLQAQGMILK